MVLAAKCNLFHFVVNGFQDIELRKRAIIMLAFLASSGKPGFEIMVTCKLPGETNFLMLILQVLVSEMDVGASAEPERSIKARSVDHLNSLSMLTFFGPFSLIASLVVNTSVYVGHC
jgi:hypothetical protein